jgi:hypothetical protein
LLLLLLQLLDGSLDLARFLLQLFLLLLPFLVLTALGQKNAGQPDDAQDAQHDPRAPVDQHPIVHDKAAYIVPP